MTLFGSVLIGALIILINFAFMFPPFMDPNSLTPFPLCPLSLNPTYVPLPLTRPASCSPAQFGYFSNPQTLPPFYGYASPIPLHGSSGYSSNPQNLLPLYGYASPTPFQPISGYFSSPCNNMNGYISPLPVPSFPNDFAVSIQHSVDISPIPPQSDDEFSDILDAGDPLLSDCDDADSEFFERRLFRVVHCSSTSIIPPREDVSSDSSDGSAEPYKLTSLTDNVINITPYDKNKTATSVVCNEISVCIPSTVRRFNDDVPLTRDSSDNMARVIQENILCDYLIVLSLFLSYYDADNKCFGDGICGSFAGISELCGKSFFSDVLDRLYSRCSTESNIDGSNDFYVDKFGFSVPGSDQD